MRLNTYFLVHSACVVSHFLQGIMVAKYNAEVASTRL